MEQRILHSNHKKTQRMRRKPSCGSRLAEALCQAARKRPFCRFLFSTAVREDFRTLYPADWKEKETAYYTEKFRIAILFTAAVCLFSGLLLVRHLTDTAIIDGSYILREDYSGSGRSVSLEVQSDGKTQNFDVDVGARKYNREQLKQLYDQMEPRLAQAVCGENESTGKVTKNLHLPASLEGFPFQITWECNDYALVSGDGELAQDKLVPEGTAVTMYATVRYADFEATAVIPLMLYPAQQTAAERFRDHAAQQLKAAESKTQYDDRLALPVQIDGQRVQWKEKTQQGALPALLLCLTAGGILYFLKDRELHGRLQVREEQMRRDYPDLVSKLSIYMGAGMTIRSAWEKLASEKPEDGQTTAHYIDQEIRITAYEIRSGIPESLAYDHFGHRCRNQLYLKFATLIQQNLKKGSNSLTRLLREEAKNAFLERKNQARQKGEEASSKLLLPMMMQLCVVMLMIMIPAFLSFQN